MIVRTNTVPDEPATEGAGPRTRRRISDAGRPTQLGVHLVVDRDGTVLREGEEP